jgi:hypothetical protein
MEKEMNCKISCSGINSNDTKLTTEDGSPISGVRRAVIKMELNHAVIAELELYTEFDVSAVAVWVMVDPLTGDRKLLRRIEFADGSTFEPK